MPLYKKYILPSGAQIVVWEMLESPEMERHILSGLSVQNRRLYEEIPSYKRKCEFLYTRHILEKELGITEVISYTEVGAPILSKAEISISHSGKFVAVGHNSSEIGIDIQVLNPKIERIAHKFVNESEVSYIGKEHSLKQQTIIWSAKEAMYKLDAKGGLLFKEQLFVAPFEVKEEFCTAGTILRQDVERACQLRVWHNNKYSLVIAEDGI